MKKRVFASILAAVILASALTACGDNEQDKKKPASSASSTTGGGSGGGDAGEDDFAYIDSYVKSLSAEHNFDGAVFNIIGREEQGFPVNEEITGEPKNDALYRRQLDLESAFNIDIDNENVDPGDNDGAGVPTAEKVFNDVNGGLNTYSLVEGNLMTCGQVMLNQKVLSTVDNIEGFDFDNSWWLNDIEDQLSVGGHLFFLTGKINPSHYGDPAALLFNKKIVEDYGVDDPYAIVKAGEWTLDKMNEIASKIPAGGDVYRYMVGSSNGLGFYAGGGFTVSERDSEGKPVVPESLSAEATSYIESIAKLLGDSSITFNYTIPTNYSYSNGGDMPDNREVFTDGKTLFWAVGMDRAAEMRNYDVEFGILPMPKRDASQKNYVALSSAWSVSGYFVPANVKDETMVGYVTEAMAALSEKYLEPAFYDEALVKGSVYDLESKEMLDLLYHAKMLDLADTYHWGGDGDAAVVKVIDNNAIGKTQNLSSSYGPSARMANRHIAQLLRTIETYN